MLNALHHLNENFKNIITKTDEASFLIFFCYFKKFSQLGIIKV